MEGYDTLSGEYERKHAERCLTAIFRHCARVIKKVVITTKSLVNHKLYEHVGN